MDKRKTLFDGEWAKARNLMNTKFRSFVPCSVCGILSCGMVWRNINTHETRCMECFTPGDIYGHMGGCEVGTVKEVIP